MPLKFWQTIVRFWFLSNYYCLQKASRCQDCLGRIFFFESGWYQHMNWWNTNFIPNQYRNSKTQLRLLGNLHRTGLWSNILFMKWISPLFFYLGRATSGNSRTLLRIAESIKKQEADWAEKKSNLRNTFSTIFRL